MEFFWIFFAFCAGFAVKLVNLPPMVGYLAAGFLLNLYGITPTANLQTLSDLGITLMLFTIGLKLQFRDIAKTEVLVSSLSHMAIWTGMGALLLLLLTGWLVPAFTDVDLRTAALLIFALSFSSTVCVVKLLEESGEVSTRHGRLALMVLIMQDLVAVIFLSAAHEHPPSPWALALPLLLLVRPVAGHLLDRIGHDELLPLTGFCLALGGYQLFELFGVKGDLGALLIGMLLSPHTKGAEIAKSLLSFKDLFLIGFFLSIGFIALPTLDMFVTAVGLTLLLPIKFGLFYLLFAGLKLRGRTSWLASLVLSNYSEFGLIVIAMAAGAGWLQQEWLVVLAMALSLSFVVTSLGYRHAHGIYRRHKALFTRFQRDQRLSEDVFGQPGDAEIIVIGIGRVGRGAYRALHDIVGRQVCAMDADHKRVASYRAEGHNVFVGDGEDADCWDNMDLSGIKLILLALPSIEDSRNIADQLRQAGYGGGLAAIARYEDEREALLAAGIDRVFNFYRDAGLGFADESLRMLEEIT